MMYRGFIKRTLDIVLSFIGILVAALPMLVVMLVIKIDSKGGAIFKQKRLGKKHKVFTMYKFRSMVINAFSDSVMVSCENDPRITRVGAFIRKTSIDELPQLWNILRGQMSIIGPRPMLPAEYEEYKDVPYMEERFEMRPGLFCTVDVEYRAEAEIQLQMEYDAKYVRECSFWIDFKCLLGVFKTVLSQSKVYASDGNVEVNKEEEHDS